MLYFRANEQMFQKAEILELLTFYIFTTNWSDWADLLVYMPYRQKIFWDVTFLGLKKKCFAENQISFSHFLLCKNFYYMEPLSYIDAFYKKQLYFFEKKVPPFWTFLTKSSVFIVYMYWAIDETSKVIFFFALFTLTMVQKLFPPITKFSAFLIWKFIGNANIEPLVD